MTMTTATHMAPASAPADRGEAPLVVVTFWLGPQRYGLPIEAVREVVRLPDLITLAGAPAALCGLLNLRGYYLPVLDGRVLIDEQAHYDLSTQIIVVGHTRPKLGLLVDRVERVATFAHAARARLQTGAAAPLLDSIVDDQQGSTILLDLATLAALAAAGQQAAVAQAVATVADQ